MKPEEAAVRRLIRRMDEIDRQEGRMRAFLDHLHYDKPSVRKRKKSLLARWRHRVRPRDGEVRTLDGSIWKNGRLLSPREGERRWT